jgi:acyl-CoA synthetase (AMP-forming)/AMP-acid ligase II
MDLYARLASAWTTGVLLEEARGWTPCDLEIATGDIAHAVSSSRRTLAFVLVRSDVASIVAYLGASRGGAAVTLLDANISSEHLSRLVDRYRPEHIIGPPTSAIRDLVGVTQHVQGSAIVARGTSAAPSPHNSLALLLPTSGTTGNPRLVRLSGSAVEANARSIARGLRLTPDARPITSLPLHYSYGLSVLHSHLVAGASIVISEPKLTDRAFWKRFRDEGCTSFAGVPYSYEVLLRLGIDQLAGSTLQTMTQAGGRLSPDKIRQVATLANDRGADFFVMYGQTEASARMAILPPEKLFDKLGSVGYAIEGGVFELVPSSQTGEAAESGELEYCGPNVMMGYADSREDLARGDDVGGRLRTGDVGRVDQDGCVWITGRLKRIGKVFGTRVSLDDVELHAATLGASIAAAVATEDRILLFVDQQTTADVRALQAGIARALGVHQSGVAIRQLTELPRLANGKIDYQELSRG